MSWPGSTPRDAAVTGGRPEPAPNPAVPPEESPSTAAARPAVHVVPAARPPGFVRALRRARRDLVRAWPVLRFVVGIGVAGLAIWVLAGQKDELGQIGHQLRHLRWWWMPVAVAVEAFSYVGFSRMQRRLLRAGGRTPPFGPLFTMTVAAQAINNSLPAGAAFSALYGFRWYRRFGAPEALATWALVGTMVGASLSLALVAAAGVALATSQGASLDLITVVVVILAITVAAGIVLVYERPLIALTSGSIRIFRRVTGHPRGDLRSFVDRAVSWITAVRLTRADAASVVGWGLVNWLFDCACFAFCFLAVGAPIPWGGVLLAYGAGQLAANLPITPGGLGAVEGSITIALVAFGGAEATTVAAVLLYRLISFWAQLPVGWSCAGFLAYQVRKGRWPRSVLAHHDEPVTRHVAETPAAPA